MRKITQILILAILILVGCNQEEYSTGAVLEEAWEKFNLESYMIGVSDAKISIVLNGGGSHGEEINELRAFLIENLSEMDKEIYDIDIQAILRLDHIKN